MVENVEACKGELKGRKRYGNCGGEWKMVERGG